MSLPLIHLPSRTIRDEDSKIRNLLQQAEKKLGFLPNMYANMANAPYLLETYLFGYDKFRTESGFSPAQQEVVLLTISRANRCHYCVAAHSFLADHVSKVPAAVTDAIRDGSEIGDDKLRALSSFTLHLQQTQGRPDSEQFQQFFAAGFSEQHLLDMLLAISVKTISNYANHLFATPVDDLFKAREWQE